MVKMIVAFALLCLAGSLEAHRFTSTGSRHLLQASAPSASSGGVRIPANVATKEAAQVAVTNATELLARAGSVTLTEVQELTTGAGHGAAEELFSAAPAGQSSSVHAGVASAGAALLAGGAAFVNTPTLVSEARSALGAAQSFVDAIRDQDILSVEPNQFADLTLLTNIAHDGTLVHYWQGAASGPQDNDTFAETIEFVSGLYEAAEEGLEEGASESLAVIAGEVVAHNILGGLYVFQGNNASVVQENIYNGQALLKAVNTQQSNTQCGVSFESVDEALEAALDAAAAAVASNSEADISSAIQAAQGAVSAASCNGVAPSIAPAQAVATGGK